MDLRIANQVVQQISFDYAITLRTDDGSQIRIETEFSIQDMEGRSIAIDPSGAGDSCTDVLSLLHETITDAAADEGTGSLSLTFGNGSLARADAHDSYEAWTFDGPRGFKCVALPGGGLSWWYRSAQPPTLISNDYPHLGRVNR